MRLTQAALLARIGAVEARLAELEAKMRGIHKTLDYLDALDRGPRHGHDIAHDHKK
jgi:hypothetical protein